MKFPSISAFAEIGSVCIIWGGYFVAMMIHRDPADVVREIFVHYGAVLILIDIFTQTKSTIL